jgi:hypothetical protein
VTAWNNTYQSLVKYQTQQKEEEADKSVMQGDETKPPLPPQSVRHVQPVAFPLRGQPLYIGDRNREAELRKDVMV